MKNKFFLSPLALILVTSSPAQSLYDVGEESQEPFPLKWTVAADLIYDDNVLPGGDVVESSFAINPSIVLASLADTPQTTWDLYGRLGFIYYFDKPTTAGGDDINSQSRVTAALTHRYSERLRFTSNSFLAYELEPTYSYGYATSRVLGAYTTWSTDNAVGYRFTERVGTFSGLKLTNTTYSDAEDNDRFNWELYNQFRYQLSSQTVLTAEYRFSELLANGAASDSQNHFFLLGTEKKYSSTLSGTLAMGLQYREVEQGASESSPYLQFAVNAKVTEDFMVRAFTRYGIEAYDTVLTHPDSKIGLVEFDDRRTLRIGLSSDYVISPTLSLVGGLDYIPTSFQGGRSVAPTPFTGSISDVEDDMVNAYVGVSVKINEIVSANSYYNYTDSSSDAPGRSYDRSRFSVGVSAKF
jgi:hypothetical protein